MKKIKINFQKKEEIIKRFRQIKINGNLIKNAFFDILCREMQEFSSKTGVFGRKMKEFMQAYGS